MITHLYMSYRKWKRCDCAWNQPRRRKGWGLVELIHLKQWIWSRTIKIWVVPIMLTSGTVLVSHTFVPYSKPSISELLRLFTPEGGLSEGKSAIFESGQVQMMRDDLERTWILNAWRTHYLPEVNPILNNSSHITS